MVRGGCLIRCPVGHDVGEEAARGALAVGDHQGVANGGLGSQNRFDLARLDAHAAHLELRVGAAVEDDRPVGAPRREVARAVHPCARFTRFGIGKEALRRCPGASKVAARQMRAAQPELAHRSGLHRSQRGVEDPRAGARKRRTDGLTGRVDGKPRLGADHGALGRPVRVDERDERRPARRDRRWQRLPAGQERLDGGKRSRLQDAEQRGRQERVGDALPVDRVEDRRAASRFRLRDDEAPCGVEGKHQLPDGDVEGGCAVPEDHAALSGSKAQFAGVRQVVQADVGDGDVLRRSRRSRGRQYVGELPRVRLLCTLARLKRIARDRFVAKGREIIGAKHHHRLGLQKDRPTSGFRSVRIDGKPGRAGLRHRQDGLGREGARQRKGDDVLVSHPATDEPAREAVGPCVERRVGQRCVRGGQRDGVGRPLDRQPQHLRQRAGGDVRSRSPGARGLRDREITQRPMRCFGCGGDDRDEARAEFLRPGLAEARAAGEEGDPDRLADFGCVHLQVEAYPRSGRCDGGDAEPIERLGAGFGRLQRQRRLDQRGLARAAFRRQRVHHLLEGNVLAVQRVERRVAHALQEESKR